MDLSDIKPTEEDDFTTNLHEAARKDSQSDCPTVDPTRSSLDTYSRIPMDSPRCNYVENVYTEFRGEELSSDDEVEREELAIWHPGTRSKVSLYQVAFVHILLFKMFENLFFIFTYILLRSQSSQTVFFHNVGLFRHNATFHVSQTTS